MTARGALHLATSRSTTYELLRFLCSLQCSYSHVFLHDVGTGFPRVRPEDKKTGKASKMPITNVKGRWVSMLTETLFPLKIVCVGKSSQLFFIQLCLNLLTADSGRFGLPQFQLRSLAKEVCLSVG